MKFRAEYVTDPLHGARVAQRGAIAGHLVHVETRADQTYVVVCYEAPDHYTARTLALTMQDNAEGTARIRRDAAMFPGAWYDLNEESPA